MNKKLGHDAIYDARELGTPRMLLLGLQHARRKSCAPA